MPDLKLLLYIRKFLHIFFEATYFILFLIWYTIHFCISDFGYLLFIASLNPFKLSTDIIRISCTPLVPISFNIFSQNLLLSFFPIQNPNTSFSPRVFYTSLFYYYSVLSYTVMYCIHKYYEIYFLKVSCPLFFYF